MKSLHIILKKSQIILNWNTESEKIGDRSYKIKFKLPILKAFSIEYFIFHEWALNFTFSNNHSNTELTCIKNWDILEIETVLSEFNDWVFALTIFYHWIRDYSELFYWVTIFELKNRLWKYYEEAEKNFNSWVHLSFLLMCWAIFEWILHAKWFLWWFNDKINTAYSSWLINENTKDIMHKVRELRNIIHWNNYNKPYPTITDFMDTRKELDNLILYSN